MDKAREIIRSKYNASGKGAVIPMGDINPSAFGLPRYVEWLEDRLIEIGMSTVVEGDE